MREKKETQNEDLEELPGGVTVLKIDGMSAAVTDAVNAAWNTVNKDTVWWWPCAALMMTAVPGVHWARISWFSIFIKFGKYFFKYLHVPLLFGGFQSHIYKVTWNVPQLRDALFTCLNFVCVCLCVFHLDSYCTVSLRLVNLSSVMSNLLLILSRGFHLTQCSFHLQKFDFSLMYTFQVSLLNIKYGVIIIYEWQLKNH